MSVSAIKKHAEVLLETALNLCKSIWKKRWHLNNINFCNPQKCVSLHFFKSSLISLSNGFFGLFSIYSTCIYFNIIPYRSFFLEDNQWHWFLFLLFINYHLQTTVDIGILFCCFVPLLNKITCFSTFLYFLCFIHTVFWIQKIYYFISNYIVYSTSYLLALARTSVILI